MFIIAIVLSMFYVWFCLKQIIPAVTNEMLIS